MGLGLPWIEPAPPLLAHGAGGRQTIKGVLDLFCGVCLWVGEGRGGVESPDCQLLCAESCSGAGNKAFPSHWIPNCPGRESALGAPPSASLAQTVAGRLLETRAAGLHQLLELSLTEGSGLPSPALSGAVGKAGRHSWGGGGGSRKAAWGGKSRWDGPLGFSLPP